MLAIVMGLETWRLGGEASLERIFTSGEFRRGAPLFFSPNLKIFFVLAPPPPPLYLKVWICHCLLRDCVGEK